MHNSYLLQGMFLSAVTALAILDHSWPGSAVGAAAVFTV